MPGNMVICRPGVNVYLSIARSWRAASCRAPVEPVPDAMMSYLGNQLALKIAGGANRASAFDGLPFPTRPLYSGNPWFLPAVGLAYRVRDWLDRRAA